MSTTQEGTPRIYVASLSDYNAFETISAIVEAMNTHSADVVGAYVAHVGTQYVKAETLADDIAEVYLGCWPSEGDYAEHLAEDLGLTTDLAAWPFTCIDWGHAASELELGGDIWISDASERIGVHIFATS